MTRNKGMHRQFLRSLMLASFVLAGAGCASSGTSAGDPVDVVGTWDYVVTDPADALNLRQGVIVITVDQGLLGGAISAPHIEVRPLENVRYTFDELTFRVQSLPGSSQGVGFSLDPEGDAMTGTAFPSSGPGSVEAGSRQSGSRRSTSLKLTKRTQ
jgi:hypothetical protein